MLTGELPLGRFAPPSASAAVDARLDEVVFRTLEREPGRRYQRISEVKTDVEAIARQEQGTGVRAAGRTELRDLDLEITRLRVKGPAIGLLITGVVFLVQVVVFGTVVGS